MTSLSLLQPRSEAECVSQAKIVHFRKARITTLPDCAGTQLPELTLKRTRNLQIMAC